MRNDTTIIPEFLRDLLAAQYSAPDADRIMEGLHARRATTLRANALKADREEVARILDGAGIAWNAVGWYPDAFVLRSANASDIRATPLYEDGKVYLQSLSSMIPALVLGARAGDDVCDMCAAPGGKTTQIAALAGGKALITACEMHAPRAEKLRFNLGKQGAGNVAVLQTDARRLDEFFSFDRILVDAPCSGSGTLGPGNPRQGSRLTPKLIDKTTKSQRALLAKGLGLLRPGGTLVYSTCSVLACENEEIVKGALAQVRAGSFEVVPVELPALAELPALPSDIDGALAVCPTDLYEGFFVAKIVRKR